MPIARAYNDWLADYCAVAPDWYPDAAMVPFQSPTDAVHELRRAKEELGFVAAFVRPNPCLGRSIVEEVYEPFWDAVEQLGMASACTRASNPPCPRWAGTAGRATSS